MADGLKHLLRQEDEDRLYSLYLAQVANPFLQMTMSFDEWKRSLYKPTPKGLSKAQVNTAVEQAQSLLNNFSPQ